MRSPPGPDNKAGSILKKRRVERFVGGLHALALAPLVA